MNISEIRVHRFGAWEDLTLASIGPGATVFYGPNEAGKTTLLNLIRTVLYGFSTARCERYVTAPANETVGGTLGIHDVSGSFEVERTASGNYRGGAGTLRIEAEGGRGYGSELLTTLLAGVNEAIFNNVFAVGLSQMQQLATLSDTEAADQLYGLAAGVDRVSLADVMQELEARRDRIAPADAEIRGELDQLLDARSRLEKELKALRRDAGHFANLRQEQSQLKKRIRKLEASKADLDGEGDWAETSQLVREHWKQALKLAARLEQHKAAVKIPPAVVERVLASRELVAARRREWVSVRDARKELKRKAKQQRGADALYRHAAEIEALLRQKSRIVELEAEVKAGQAGVDELEFEIQAVLEEIGLETGLGGGRLPEVPPQVIEALREPARQAREARQVVETYKEMAQQQRTELEGIRQQLDSASARFGGERVEKAIERSFERVANLERRLNLDDERDDLSRQLDDLERDTHYWRERTVLPWKGVLAACGLFSIGIMLLVTGGFPSWFGVAEAQRTFLMTIGGSLAAISLVLKGAFEHRAQENAERCERQMERLHEEREEAQEETVALDATLDGQGNLDQQLADARAELAELDQFVPLQQRHAELRAEVDAVEAQTTLAVRQLKDARRAWKASLRAAGLPDSLTPAQVGQISAKIGQISHLRQRATQLRDELTQRAEAFAAISERAGELLSFADVHECFDGIALQLDELERRLGEHREAGQQKEALRHEWETLGTKQAKLAQLARQILDKRGALLAEQGLHSTRAFQRNLRLNQRAKELQSQQAQLLQTLQELLGEGFSAKKLAELLAKRSMSVLQHVQQRDEQSRALLDELTGLRERGLEVTRKLDQQMADRRSERKELEIVALDERIEAACRHWHQAATTAAVLDRIKDDYESKRQPVALAEASRYLDRFTEGRYVRIWTPMGKNALCVDDCDGQTLSVAKLSRGSRELVYLSLRLALVSAYGRRGANMPMVLDDVFVNFDDRRAVAAARVLAELAQAGQQFLIFTCHTRIQQAFAELSCDVRTLPSREGQAAVEPATTVAEQEPLLPPTASEEPDPLDAEFVEPLDASPLEPDRFEPEWRDEYLEPYPDLAADASRA